MIERIDTIRGTILANAEQRGWTLDPNQLDDRHIIRRMVLKRCVYGVDKNPMAVELTKVSLWLHTFTVGAPLSYLDHHLRCGDSLFGAWMRPAMDKAEEHGALFLREPLNRATHATAPMQTIEGLTDAEIAESDRSAEEFGRVLEMTAPLNALLSLLHAFDWMDLRAREDRSAYLAWLDGSFGDPVDIAQGGNTELPETETARRFTYLLERARDTHRGGTFPELAGGVPRRLVGLGGGGVAWRLRCRSRKSALGPDEIAAGRMVRRPTGGDRHGAAGR